MKKNIFGYTLGELESIVDSEYSVRPFVARQLWSWLYCRGIRNFAAADNISKNLRSRISEDYSCDRPILLKELISLDGTRKWLLELHDGEKIELVYIPADDRGTLCLSTQVGCAMGCRFCNTGTQGFVRNLETREIVQEVILAKDLLGEWTNRPIGEGRKITNIVLMGMGEPLLNYDNVMKAMSIINNRNGVAFSCRRITLSTCGIVPAIDRMGKDLKLNLALSLHGTTDEMRKKIMPIAEKYTIEQTLEACSRYSRRIGRGERITFEYMMIKNFNDNLANARKLLALVEKYRIPAKFNLIPFNRWENSPLVGEPSDPERIREFANCITSAGYPCPIRQARGLDIMAACGQLRSSSK
jgi:23S rRNA (adenine2503-C2)-methyltransferase